MYTIISEPGHTVIKLPPIDQLQEIGMPLPPWDALTIKEASEISGYSQEYLRRLVRRGKLEAAKIGTVIFVRADSLKSYVAEMKDSDDARTGPRREGKG